MSFKRFVLPVVIIVGLVMAYFAVVLNWSYSMGERAGWVQKLSKKGWICKTWEGEQALVSQPGAVAEKFLFTIHDEAVADEVNRLMGKRVALHYEEKVGLPTSCFGDTRYFVTKVVAVDDITLTPGVVVHTAPASSPESAASAP